MEQKQKGTISWLADFAGRKKSLYTASVIFAVLGVICSVLPYIILADMITELIGKNMDWGFYLQRGIFIILLWLLRVIFHGISTSCSHKATFAVLANIRKTLCNKLARVPLGQIKSASSGSLKNIIVERVDSIETTLAHILPEFTANILAPIGVFIFMMVIDWRMGLVSLITLVIGIIAYMGMMIGYEESFKNSISKTKNLNDTAVEYINGIEVIKAFGKAKSSYEKFKVAAREGADCYIEWMRRCNVFMSIAMVIMPCTTLAVLPIGGMFYMNGSLSLADFIICIILSMGLIVPLITVMSYSDDIGKMGAIVGEVTGVLTWKNLKRPEKSMALPVDNTVVLTDVTFGYKEKEVLHGINMELKEGSVTALVGPSGSGKSTIAKLIASLWDVDGGSIEIGGVNINQLALTDYNQMVAYVSQDNYLFDDTIRENIRMGCLMATDEQVIEAAKKSGCHEFIMALENGYDTIAGGAGGHLSGGERQRISIARAMLKNAPILILDEATAYTDPENEAIIQASVAKLVQGKTLIVIAHRLSTIADADQIYVIKDGIVAEEGKQEELLAKNGIYANMWNSHMEVKNMEREVEYNA